MSARKMETLLTALLIRAGRVVSVEQLIQEIWGQDPPRRATAGLHVYISQLRKFLHRPDQPASPIITRTPGYFLRLGADELDLRDFQRLVHDGRAHAKAQRHAEAVDCFDAALALWRGPVFGDLGECPIVKGCITWLEEARLECVEMQIDSRLMLGQHREMVGQLYVLREEYPLREVFYRQLMLALYRSERKADALTVYQAAQRTLKDELGLEPCQALRNLQCAILRADDRLDLALAM